MFVVTKSHKHERGNFVIWEEGRSLDVVIEVTSRTTMREDLGKKSTLYLTKLGVKEYYLFDPKEEYLKPSFQAFRRVGERFVPIEPVAGRFPSKLLKLHLERSGWQLRLWDPVRKQRAPTRASAWRRRRRKSSGCAACFSSSIAPTATTAISKPPIMPQWSG